MAICNRDLGQSEQIRNMATTFSQAGSSLALELPIAQMPWPGTVQEVSFGALAVANAPVVSLGVKRWTSGGLTTMPYLSTTLTLTAFGASAAYQSPSLLASGSTLLNLLAGDVLYVRMEIGATASITGGFASVGVQASQDIKSYFDVIPGN